MPASPLVGVTIGAVLEHTGLPYFGLNRQYVDALQGAGARVVLIPTGEPPAADALLAGLDGVLFPGGLDVHPRHYGDEARPDLGRTDAALDALELPLARAAAERRLPVLGICRGQQLVNVALGGSLYQDLRADGVTEVEHWTPLAKGRDHLCHEIALEPSSRLAGLVGGARRLQVNSFHHQAVKEVAPDLRVTATSPDGVIEALESADGLVLTVQCHPEGLPAQRWARDLFAGFVELAAGRRVPAPRVAVSR